MREERSNRCPSDCIPHQKMVPFAGTAPAQQPYESYLAAWHKMGHSCYDRTVLPIQSRPLMRFYSVVLCHDHPQFMFCKVILWACFTMTCAHIAMFYRFRCPGDRTQTYGSTNRRDSHFHQCPDSCGTRRRYCPCLKLSYQDSASLLGQTCIILAGAARFELAQLAHWFWRPAYLSHYGEHL